MIHAYDEQYVDDAMRCLGEAMDYAVNELRLDMDAFFELFIGSGLAEEFEKGVPRRVSGLSGMELVLEVLSGAGFRTEVRESYVDYTCSPQYWCGWVLAYYQWYTGRSFKDIQQHISMLEIEKLYPTLHEASEKKFVDVVNGMIRRGDGRTALQRQRRISGYSQRELAKRSGVNLRTLQQYESRAKDINRASAGSVRAMARVLGCRMEDLLEYDISDAEE